MYARVGRGQVAPERLEAAVQRLREHNIPAAQREGAKGVLILVDRATGKAMVISLYETEEALRASEATFQERVRRTESHQAGTSSVEVYEVADDIRL